MLMKDLSTRTMPHSDLANMNLFDVSHITAIVTGAGSGIGVMITQGLAANGAKVYITGRRKEALQQVADKYKDLPGTIIPLTCDVSSKEDVEQLVSQITAQEPQGIQLLINNAGVAMDDEIRYQKNTPPARDDPVALSEHFMRSESQTWDTTFRINVTGPYFMSMAFLPLLAKGQEATVNLGFTSSVINMSSISGVMKTHSAGQFSYAASKAASTHLTKMLATTFALTKVRVNCIAPGFFPTEMTDMETKQDDDGENGERKRSTSEKAASNLNPLGRNGTPEDMAATVLFLASKAGAFYNSQILYPDGGTTMFKPASN